MLMNDQQRCNIQGLFKSVLNSFKAAKTCKSDEKITKNSYKP